MPRASSRSHNNPFLPSCISSTGPAARAATTAQFCCQASRMTLPSGSIRDEQTKTSARCIAGRKSFCQPINSIRSRTPNTSACRARLTCSGPSPANHSVTLGKYVSASISTSKPLLRCNRPAASKIPSSSRATMGKFAAWSGVNGVSSIKFEM